MLEIRMHWTRARLVQQRRDLVAVALSVTVTVLVVVGLVLLPRSALEAFAGCALVVGAWAAFRRAGLRAWRQAQLVRTGAVVLRLGPGEVQTGWGPMTALSYTSLPWAFCSGVRVHSLHRDRRRGCLDILAFAPAASAPLANEMDPVTAAVARRREVLSGVPAPASLLTYFATSGDVEDVDRVLAFLRTRHPELPVDDLRSRHPPEPRWWSRLLRRGPLHDTGLRARRLR